MTFDEAFDRLIEHEGGYVNHPSDPGGETMFGVTARVAREHGYTGPMKLLPIERAKIIAKSAYWDRIKADQYDGAIGFQVFDAGYNHGIGNAIRFLQRAVGVADDGAIGPRTLAAIQRMPVTDVIARFNAERLDFYTKLSTWPQFGKGWARRIVANLKYQAEDA
jgi:lysozyme family protein